MAMTVRSGKSEGTENQISEKTQTCKMIDWKLTANF